MTPGIYYSTTSATNQGIFIIVRYWCLSNPAKLLLIWSGYNHDISKDYPEDLSVRTAQPHHFPRPSSQTIFPTRGYYLRLLFVQHLTCSTAQTGEELRAQGIQKYLEQLWKLTFYPSDTSSASDTIPTPALGTPRKNRPNTKAWSVSRRHQQLCGPFWPTKCLSPYACHTETNNSSIDLSSTLYPIIQEESPIKV